MNLIYIYAGILVLLLVADFEAGLEVIGIVAAIALASLAIDTFLNRNRPRP